MEDAGASIQNGPGHPGGSTPSKKVYGEWIKAEDKPIHLHVEGGGGKRFLEMPVSFVSSVTTFTNSSSSNDHTTEAEARVEAMVKVILNGREQMVYPPHVTMLERDQKLTVTADNLACLEEIEGEWVTCSNQSDVQCECGVNVALMVEETVATTFNFYAYPLDSSGTATVELYYRLSGYVKVDDNGGEVPNNSAFTAGVVYNTMSAQLLQMPEWQRGEIYEL